MPLEQNLYPSNKILAVAPMMAWTDRHCRYLHRLYAPGAVLFTEMITTGALLRGQQWHLLNKDDAEHPLTLQLGGNDPVALAQCAVVAQARGYNEVNLNVGCPSERVQKGTFGVCLMRQPSLVARCVSTMQKACDLPITVKCRLGVDDYDSDELLNAFVEEVSAAGCTTFYLHARKAILGGLTAAQNREIPPLQPQRVKSLKLNHPELTIVINGGIAQLENVTEYLQWADGVMIGRAAYYQPDLLSQCHKLMYDRLFNPCKQSILERYRLYIAEQLKKGVRLHSMTRHLLSSCNGLPGARRFRQTLSNSQLLKNNDASIIEQALEHVFKRAA